MSQSISIELPDDLVQQAEASASNTHVPLQKLMADVLIAFLSSLRSLQNRNPDIRIKAIQELGNLRAEATIPILKSALQDEDLAVQKAAVEALQSIGTEEALNILRQSTSIQFDTDTSTFFFDPLTPLIGSLQSDVSDIAENHDAYLTKALEQELRKGD